MYTLAQLIKQLPNLDELADQYGPPARPKPASGKDELAPKAIASTPGWVKEVAASNTELFAAGGRALAKIRKKGADAKLKNDEAAGLEAIVLLEGRPAILVQDGHFFPPPAGWQMLELGRAKIETVLQSVGRIEVSGHASLEWVGTGFLVANGVVMTNRHVAVEFCKMSGDGKWCFMSGMRGRIDYIEELGATHQAEFALKSIIGIHDKYDLALFRVEHISADGQPTPQPLVIASRVKAPAGRKVYTVGYPAWDGRRNDPAEMQRIFTNIYNVKRLQPGEIVQTQPNHELVHDCSTLGGNSGSCVVDLETHQVLGLHFGGRYLEGNRAVALWQLIGDPLIQKAKLNFV